MGIISNLLAKVTKRASKVDAAVRKAAGKRPTDSALMELQRELMSDLYYGVFKSISRRNAGNTYSYGYKKGSDRPKFTARGAYLFRKDINEAALFHLGYYENSNNIITTSLTNLHKGQDLDVLIVAARDTLLTKYDMCEEQIERDERGKVINEKSLDEYWQLYMDLIVLMPMYFFDQKDVNYFLDHTYRALFKLIAMEKLTQDGPIKEALRDKLEEDLYRAAQTGFHPLNVSTFTHLRNCLPTRITKRLSTVQLKVKKLNQGDYVSPVEHAKNMSLR